jgi:hypothetical protein
MPDLRFLYKEAYAESRALVIGINRYANTSHLSYAVSDAEAVKNALVIELGFPESNVISIYDENATKQNILSAYHQFTRDNVGLDDRVIVFYAGHGHTLTGIRGEVGYLVPYDADPDDTSTLIRWDELTRNADLIRAKHLLFIMDACYGGLALTRSSRSGSARFLRDMLLRYSRQVLTAGKADEVVADAGGPLPDHSVFTGHLLEGLQGKAQSDEGIITASGLMSYVYNKVARDPNSNQTPHHGHLDGDGDFILKYSIPKGDEDDHAETGRDRLLILPFPSEVDEPLRGDVKVDRIKQLITSESSLIELHDTLVQEVKAFIANSREEFFAVSAPYSQEELLDRLRRYEEVADHLSMCASVLSYWSTPKHLPILYKIVSRSVDSLEQRGGTTIWLALRWYPAILLLYKAGIAAVDANNYESLATLFQSEAPSFDGRYDETLLIESVSSAISELLRSTAFKQIPGHEKFFTPLSEYLFKTLQPQLDEIFFLGIGYEKSFDTFEIILALASSDYCNERNGYYSALPGRFFWKHKRSSSHRTSPLDRVISEANAKKENWEPIRAGMFGGSIARFEAVAADYARTIGGISFF